MTDEKKQLIRSILESEVVRREKELTVAWKQSRASGIGDIYCKEFKDAVENVKSALAAFNEETV